MFNRIGFLALTVTAAVGLQACQRSSESGTSDAEGRGVAPLVKDYLQVADAAGEASAEFDAQFLADALRKLAAALGTLNLGNLDLQVALRVSAEHVLSNPQSVETTTAVRNSLVSAAEAIEAGGASDSGLRQAAESLQPDRPLPDQVAMVRDFLQRSGPALRRAAGERGGAQPR